MNLGSLLIKLMSTYLVKVILSFRLLYQKIPFEDIERLRFLEFGYEVFIIGVHSGSLAVDFSKRN
ncbi:hypothetical protein DN730_10515 [Marinomonas piezotolerans]|uniref:Uncharacterized protein n=1 Tax=Marinomonas piezotolerans TaxID=2213058 RepID=A0A370U8F6_9GAMM|nr:hypothetical protein DN730_10515 [Marinomonas piezotolerans]